MPNKHKDRSVNYEKDKCTQNGNTVFMNHQIIIEEVQNETED